MCYVEDEDPAIATLAEHFTNVIHQISDGKWYHLPSKWTSKKDHTTVRVIDITYFENDRVLDSTPEPFFLHHHRLGEKLFLLREKVALAFRQLDFDEITPLITEIFSTDFVGIADSGINLLFPPPKRGRPKKADSKKRNRQDFDVEYRPTTISSKRNLRRRTPKRMKSGKGPIVDSSSSDTNKVLSISDILLQAKDIKTGKVKVFVEWDDRPLADASWILLDNLNMESAQWWRLLKEVRYPLFHNNLFPSNLW